MKVASFLTLAATSVAAFILFAVHWMPQGSLGALPAGEPVFLPTGAVEHLGEQEALLSARLGPSRHVYSPPSLSGVVTSVPTCRPGAIVSEGDVVFGVDGIDRVAIATPEPPVNNPQFATGLSPSDLIVVLVRLGHLSPIDGHVDATELDAAVARFYEQTGGAPAGGASDAYDRLVWIPAPDLRIAHCAVEQGQSVVGGAEIAAIERDILEARVADYSEETGPHQISFGSATYPLRHDGVVMNASTLSLPPEATDSLSSIESWIEVPVLLSLVTPIDAVSVPATALLIDEAVCVIGRSSSGVTEAIPVTVLSSEFGRSLVATMGRDANLREVLANPRQVQSAWKCETA